LIQNSWSRTETVEEELAAADVQDQMEEEEMFADIQELIEEEFVADEMEVEVEGYLDDQMLVVQMESPGEIQIQRAVDPVEDPAVVGGVASLEESVPHLVCPGSGGHHGWCCWSCSCW